MRPDRVCARSVCRRPIPDGARSDAVYCGKGCRQAAHRFARDVAAGLAVGLPTDTPRTVSIYDPPYVGRARLYKGHPDYRGEVEHERLVAGLADDDGWALATDEVCRGQVEQLLRDAGQVFRMAVWVRGAYPSPSRWPARSYEVVYYRPARHDVRQRPPSDVLVHAHHPRTEERGVIGSKPAAWWGWVLALLDARPGDVFRDVFPGSGGGDDAWRAWCDASRAAERDASRGAPETRRGLVGATGDASSFIVLEHKEINGWYQK